MIPFILINIPDIYYPVKLYFIEYLVLMREYHILLILIKHLFQKIKTIFVNISVYKSVKKIKRWTMVFHI